MRNLRNAELPVLVEMLQKQHDLRYDAVVSSNNMRFQGGQLLIAGGATRITDTGVAFDNAILNPTPIFDEGAASRFNIPMRYMNILRNRVATDIEQGDPKHVPTIYDENLNYWLDADPSRTHLVRAFRTDDPDEVGIGRALLSDKYKTIDNYDVLMATLDGVKEAGVEINIDGVDLSDKRMSLRLKCPTVAEYAPDILQRYRDPESGNSGKDNPIIYAGLVIKNSETGNGAFNIVPRLVVEVCSNGLQMTQDAMRAVHLGGKLDEGVVRWSDDTQRRELELITSKTKDAVSSFLDIKYMKVKLQELRALADIDVPNPVKVIDRVAKKVHWSEKEKENILSHFIKGSDQSALGVAQAVTSVAQRVKSVDRQDELETSALTAASFVATV